MSVTDLLPALGGVLAGIVVTFVGYTAFLRSKKRDSAGLIEQAQQEARAALDRARDEASKAKAALVVEGKTEVLKLREDVDRDAARRREEMDRAERRLEDRDRSIARRAEEIEREA